MSDPNQPAPESTNAQDPNAQATNVPPQGAEDPTRREAARQALQAWGEELKQEIASRLDQKLDELGARISSI